MWDEFVVESHHPEEGAEVGKAAGRRKIADALNFIFRHPYSLTADDVEAKEITFLGEPFALVRLQAEAVVSEGFENEANMFLMLFQGSFGVNDNVVKIGVAEDAEVRVKDGVDKSLEDRGCRSKSHGHDGILIGSEECFESGGLFRARCHAEVREARSHVHGGNPVSSGEIVHESTGEGDRIFVEDDFTIEVAVIDNKTKLTGATAGRGIADEEDGR